MALHSDDPRSVGGYKVVDRLGNGGMGVVYRARARSGREVAVKVVHAQYAQDPVFRARFRQEIEAVRKVSGAFTAPVVDADPEAVRPWMATQYVPGRSLAQLIRDRGPLRAGALRPLALGLVEALREIHRAGVVHRDLKPANVLIADDGPRVIDFGISRAAENLSLTETGQMIGTPPFMSPEQLTDARTAGPSSDVFSLGTLLVYALTGRGPFDADSPYLTAYRVVHDEPVLDGVDAPLRAILERCLAKDAADRPGLDELAREFAAVLPEPGPDDLPAAAPRTDTEDVATEPRPASTAEPRPAPATDPGPAPRPARRRRVRQLLAVTGTAGALVLGLTAYLLGPGDTDTTDTAAPKPTSTSRWTAPPDGWRPWQTTVFAKGPAGTRQPLAVNDGNTGGAPSCQAHGNAVYCGGDGVLPVRVDSGTGKIVWRADLAPAGHARDRYYASVLGVRDGTVLVRQTVFSGEPVVDPVDLVALDADTGERLWTRRTNSNEIDPALTGDLVLVPEPDGVTVTARSPRTGAERWSLPMPVGHACAFTTAGAGTYAHCRPVTREAKAANPESRVLVVDRADGSARTVKVPLNSVLLGVRQGDLVLVVENTEHTENTDATPGSDPAYETILLLDLETGNRVTTKPGGKGEYGRGRAALAGDVLVFTRSGGQVTAVSPHTGELLWRTRTSLERPGAPGYDAASGTVYLASTTGRVAALDRVKGTLLWETLPRATPTWPFQGAAPWTLPHEGALFVAVPDGTLFSLDPAHPDREPVSG
ncbi:serine/threonine-protein kinase [Streptomyces griseiscabiei]|uniref:Serine/threonine-protein kinase n=2 Tax=Streptomyces griseiscabiei TaxID=2993540 RepID=A0ABU4KW58_9ACTN|nr:serine/threonine-protein kinase [Streptomyces griseiscabiei]MBZ3903222.1 PQQ-binding-like beta-propeller repeat protein [Streptomyces griseiscabiei]MDX2907533.1 serine/threonine-protein kinase [Streptomyces griseiscabiei]